MNRHLIPALAACAFLLASSGVTLAATQAQTQAQNQSQAKPEAKPEAAPGLAGKWNVTVQTPNGNVDSGLDLKIEEKKVSGIITSQMGEAKIEGELVDGKLTFWFTMDANGQSINITFVGTQQKDGSLAGTFNFGQGEMTWTAVRAK